MVTSMKTDGAFNQAILKSTGKPPQQNLIDIFDQFTLKELHNRPRWERLRGLHPHRVAGLRSP